MRHYNKIQNNQGEVLNDCCYITFTLVLFILKVTLLPLLFS